MSSKSSNQTQKYANSNLNSVLQPRTASSAPSGTAGINRYNGMLVFSKRPRTAVGSKLSVPKPVNLPSIKKEHAGNDPTTQLVPSGGGSGSWNKPEDIPAAQPEPAFRQPSLTAGSTWASQQPPQQQQQPRPASTPAAGPWQQPTSQPAPQSAPYGLRGPSFPAAGERHLNPDEYPSLAAGGRGGAQISQKPSYKAGFDQQGDVKSWADDERAPPVGSLRGPPDWHRDDDRLGGEREYSSQWDGYRDRSQGRLDYEDRYGPPRSGHVDDEHEFARNSRGYYDSYGAHRGPDMPPPPPPRRGDRYPYDGPVPERYDSYDDRGLFPPPPPPRHQQPTATDANSAAEPDYDVDPERQAFEAELERVAADLAKRKLEERESIAEKRSLPPPEAEELLSQAESQQTSDTEGGPAAPRGPPSKPQPRISREAVEEEERLRKQRAAEKLRQLEEQIAARNAAEAALKGAAAASATASTGQVASLSNKPKDDLEDLDWEDKDNSVPLKRGIEEEQEAEPPRPLPPPEPQPNRPPSSPPPTPPPPPPRQQQLHLQPQQHMQQQQHGQAVQQPPHFQQQLPPPPPPPHPAAPHYMAPVGGRPLTAVFGSFDENLLEELNRSATAAQQPASEPEPVKPKPWRPAEGTTPTLLTHAPLAHLPPPPPPPPQQHQQQQHQQPAVPAGPANAWGQKAAAPAAADAAKAQEAKPVEPSGAEKRPPRDLRELRGGRSRGEGGRGGRGRGAPSAPANAVAPEPAAVEASSDTAAAPAASAPAAADAGTSAETTAAAASRGGRGRGAGRGSAVPAADKPERGGRSARGRGGRAGRGGDASRSEAEGDQPAESAGAVDTAAAAAAGEPRAKRERRGSRDGIEGQQAAAPRANGPGGREGSGRGRGEGRGGRGGRNREQQQQAPIPAGVPTSQQSQAPPSSNGPLAASAAARPLAADAAVDSKHPSGAGLAGWGTTSSPKPIPTSSGVSLNDPVMAEPVVGGAVNLPASLDLAPSKPLSAAPVPIGFDRQVGPKGGALQKAPGAPIPIGGAGATGSGAAPGAKASGLDNGMPQLPADLSDVMGIGAVKPTGLGAFHAAPGLPGSNIRPLGPGFAFGTMHDAPGSGAMGIGSAPPGIAAMWADQGTNTLGNFVPHSGPMQHPHPQQPHHHSAALGVPQHPHFVSMQQQQQQQQQQQPQQHQPAVPNNLSAAMQSFYSAAPPIFPGTQPPVGAIVGPGNPPAAVNQQQQQQKQKQQGSQQAQQQQQQPPPQSQPQQQQPPLMLGQFNQFAGAPFVPPRPFVPPTGFGGLGPGSFFGQQPFVPTNKQPDWSIGPGPVGGMGSQSGGLAPPGLGPLGRLDLQMHSGPFSMAAVPGSNVPGDNAPGSKDMGGNAGAGFGAAGGLPNLAASEFPNSKAQQHTEQGSAHPQRNKLGTGNLHGPAFGSQQGHGAGPNRRGGMEPKLPDDIFGLDTKPAGGSKSHVSDNGPGNAQATRTAAVPPPAAHEAAPGQQQQQQQHPQHPQHPQGGRAGGRGGRGGRGGDHAAPNIENGPGRGFAGRNGRGAGRANALAAERAADTSSNAAAAANGARASVAGPAAGTTGSAEPGAGAGAGPQHSGPSGGRGERGHHHEGSGGRGRNNRGGRGGEGGRGSGRSGGRSQANVKMVYVPKGPAPQAAADAAAPTEAKQS